MSHKGADAMTSEANPTVPRAVNMVVKRVLRSPAHRLLSRNTMLVSFTGRRSGCSYTVAVSYVRIGPTLVCYTDSGWWRNLRGGVPVGLVVAGRTTTGVADVVTLDPDAAVEALAAFLRQSPRDARYHGVGTDRDGTLDAVDLARASSSSVRIEITMDDR
jgi:hypothetical protein